MKTNLATYCENYNFEKLFAKKGYKYFKKGYYNLNIIGVRKTNKVCTDHFDDVCVVIYKDGKEHITRKIYSITTNPGAFYLREFTNVKGCAILVPGQYVGCWELGFHKNHSRALVQRKPVKVYRDNNRDNIYDLDPTSIDTGVFGINLHKAGPNSFIVNNWSAGCQVWKNAKDHSEFIGLCDRQVNNGLGKSFTYTLIDEEDLHKI